MSEPPAEQVVVGATDGAIAAIERLALEELRPGDLLPSEGALAVQLGVSRLTVREATRSLEARGLVELRKGRRPLVLAPNGRMAGHFFQAALRRDPAAAYELLEVRRALEVHIAALAATVAPRAALAAMATAIEDMRASLTDEAPFQEADIRFHEALAAGTGNSMLLQLIEQIAEPLMAVRLRSFAGHLLAGLPVQEIVDAHQAVLDAVAARDPTGAAEAMQAHLRQTERDLRAALRE